MTTPAMLQAVCRGSSMAPVRRPGWLLEHTRSRVRAGELARWDARRNLYQMRAFFQAYPEILQTMSAKSGTRKLQTLSAESVATDLAAQFPLPWSHYVRLLSVNTPQARSFYEYKVMLPAEKTLSDEIERTRKLLEPRGGIRRHPSMSKTP